MGRPKLSRQTNFSGANGKGKNAYSAKNEQHWQPYPVDPYSAESADHTYPDHTPSSSRTYARCENLLILILVFVGSLFLRCA